MSREPHPSRTGLRSRRASLAAAGALAALAVAQTACRSTGPETAFDPTDLPRRRAWHVIELAEFERRPTPDLYALLDSRDNAVRRRALTALGRMPWPETGPEPTRLLLEALDDPGPLLRATAAFALGVRRDPRSGDRLARLATDFHEPDPESEVRAAALEAASVLDRPDLREALLFGLADPAELVRIEAAVAPHRWSAADADAAATDAALLGALERETSAEVIWRLLFTLQRRGSAGAQEAFLAHAESSRDLERLFAAKGLAWRAQPWPETAAELARTAEEPALPDDERVLAALVRAAADADERVAVEALRGLGAWPARGAAAAVERAAGHTSPHVRATAAVAWADLVRLSLLLSDSAWARAHGDRLPEPWLDPTTAIRVARELAVVDRSEEVRAAALPALVLASGPLGGASAAEVIAALPFDSPEPLVRGAAARALAVGLPPSEATRAALVDAARDPHPAAAGPAIGALGLYLRSEADPDSAATDSHAPDSPASDSPDPGSADVVRADIRGFLGHADEGLRLAAVLALAEVPDPRDLPALERAWGLSHGDLGPEVRFSIVHLAGAIGTPRARSLCAVALGDPSFHVRRVARAELEERFPEFPLPDPVPPVVEISQASIPLRGRDWRVRDRNPHVEIVTTRGTLLFELFEAEAPWHVTNFLVLASRGQYDTLTFHRVVPDFVIQGGDPRGDGNGGTTITGHAMPHEISPRKYVRGSLGMPRNEDWDSGGSQIFVTHRPTPHLDGRYTIFGELREGTEVLAAIELGDRILEVRRPRR